MRGGEIDAGEIKARLIGQLSAVLDRYCAGWVRRGQTAFLAPKSKRDLGSWQLHLAGAKAGGWTRYSQGVSGDVIDLLAYVATGNARDRRAGFAEARAFLGLARRESADDAQARRQAALRREREARERADREAAEAVDRQRYAAASVELWRRAVSAAGSPVEAYLAGRAIDLTPPASLRFRPRAWHAETRTMLPAMVGLVQEGPSGRPTGVHLTYLVIGESGATKADVTKADVAPAKRMVGVTRGGHVRLGPAGAELIVAEGIETALSVMAATDRVVWAALSLGNLDAALPEAVRAVVLAVDMDEAFRQLGRAERRAARPAADPEVQVRRAVAAHAQRGLAVRIARPPKGFDFNDWMRALTRDDAA